MTVVYDTKTIVARDDVKYVKDIYDVSNDNVARTKFVLSLILGTFNPQIKGVFALEDYDHDCGL